MVGPLLAIGHFLLEEAMAQRFKGSGKVDRKYLGKLYSFRDKMKKGAKRS